MQSVLSSVVGLVDHIQFVDGRRCVFFLLFKVSAPCQHNCEGVSAGQK